MQEWDNCEFPKYITQVRPMSLCKTKQHLTELLDDPDNRVIALSGKWGTGKSHLWRQLQAESSNTAIREALYVSLFGLTSMVQVKEKIVLSWNSQPMDTPKWRHKLLRWIPGKLLWQGGKTILPMIHSGFSTLGEAVLLAMPLVLKKRVVVFDDIERKHQSLDIDELLGFIDEFSQRHETRIVLILNSDKLTDKFNWDNLREKVVDHEIQLQTTPREAFNIALCMNPTLHSEQIRQAIETCSVTNIRVICKVIKTLNRILGDGNQLSPDVLSRLVPSTVLLSVIHFRGMDDGPDFDFVLNIGAVDSSHGTGGTEEPASHADKTSRWRRLLQELSIYGCDDYEYLVTEFLESGMLELSDVEKVIRRYRVEAELLRATTAFQALREHILWYYTMTDAELIDEAGRLVPIADHLDVRAVTWLHTSLSQMDGGQAVAEALLEKCIAAFQGRNDDLIDFDSLYERPVHPRIRAAIDEVRAERTKNTTLFEACERVAKEQSWGKKEEAVMKTATVAQFESTIKTLDPPDLKLFLLRFVDLCVNERAYVAHFGSAMEHFTFACRNIVSDTAHPRLARILKMVFEEANLASHLEGRTPDPVIRDQIPPNPDAPDNERSPLDTNRPC